MGSVATFFKFETLKTGYRQETIAGLTTFATVAYIIVVNPKILEAAGMPFGASLVATVLTAFIGTLLMGVYAKRPFAIAPYMGENAFVAFTVVKVMGYSWQTALGAIFISAAVFAVLTLLKLRGWLVQSIPMALKIAFSVGIGLFLIFIGLSESGIVQVGVPSAPVHVGNLTEPSALLAILGFLFTGVLMVRKVPAAIILGILGITVLAFILRIIPVPQTLMSAPPDISPLFARLDIVGALQWKLFPVLLTMFVMIFVDTMGTLIGVSYKAGFLDNQGNLPEIEKPMLCDSLATMAGAVLGTTTAGAYIESAAGIQAGGRSGFTAVVTALLFLTALFLTPLFTVIPPYAYGPALILVGMQMLTPLRNLDFEDLSEIIPGMTVITLTCFTYNLGIGMTAGFIVYPLVKAFSGQIKAVPIALWILGAVSLVFFMVYPY